MSEERGESTVRRRAHEIAYQMAALSERIDELGGVPDRGALDHAQEIKRGLERMIQEMEVGNE